MVAAEDAWHAQLTETGRLEGPKQGPWSAGAAAPQAPQAGVGAGVKAQVPSPAAASQPAGPHPSAGGAVSHPVQPAARPQGGSGTKPEPASPGQAGADARAIRPPRTEEEEAAARRARDLLREDNIQEELRALDKQLVYGKTQKERVAALFLATHLREELGQLARRNRRVRHAAAMRQHKAREDPRGKQYDGGYDKQYRGDVKQVVGRYAPLETALPYYPDAPAGPNSPGWRQWHSPGPSLAGTARPGTAGPGVELGAGEGATGAGVTGMDRGGSSRQPRAASSAPRMRPASGAAAGSSNAWLQQELAPTAQGLGSSPSAAAGAGPRAASPPLTTSPGAAGAGGAAAGASPQGQAGQRAAVPPRGAALGGRGAPTGAGGQYYSGPRKLMEPLQPEVWGTDELAALPYLYGMEKLRKEVGMVAPTKMEMLATRPTHGATPDQALVADQVGRLGLGREWVHLSVAPCVPPMLELGNIPLPLHGPVHCLPGRHVCACLAVVRLAKPAVVPCRIIHTCSMVHVAGHLEACAHEALCPTPPTWVVQRCGLPGTWFGSAV